MPSAKKVAWAELRVGVVALIAMIILGTLVFLITGKTSFFQKKVSIYTFLSDSSALTKGANVRVNGILAGRVLQVELSGSTEKRKVVKVQMEIDENMLPQVPSDSVAAISAENVLGSKYINIKKGTSPTPLTAGGEVKSKDTSEFDDVVDQGYNVMASAQGMLLRIDKILQVVERGEGSIGKLIYDEELYSNLNLTAAEARKILVQINSGKGTASKLLYDEAVLDDVRSTLSKVNKLIDGLEQGEGTAGKLLKDKALYEDLRKTLNQYNKLAADLNAGKGSVGKLLKDDALHKQIEGTIARMDVLLDKVNKGEGTIGQLMVNPQLYESMNGTMRDVQLFMKDFRANPKKFLSIKLGLF
jgi:phospholipid/cholesterol/gamma-HCH transport system substrate-binding protein